MNLTLSPEQEELRTAVRTLLVDHASSQQIRAVMQSELGYDRKTWYRLGTELGVLGLVVPERHGGADAGHTERAIVAEELGRALVPSPFFGSAVLAVDTLLALPDEPTRDELLHALATGERIGALAAAEAGTASLDPTAIATRANRRGGRWVLDGSKSPVIAGDVADLLLVFAGTDDGPALFGVSGDAPGLSRTALRTLDPTRRVSRIDFVGTPAIRLDGGAVTALNVVSELSTVARAAEQVGGMRRALELTVDYAKTRVQFGRTIGSFQAVKHGCADMYVAVEQAYSMVRYATWVADHDPTELSRAAALAQVYIAPAYFEVANRMVQYHGGLGYTWEHDAHLYYKRAKTDELLFGAPQQHRGRLADLLEV